MNEEHYLKKELYSLVQQNTSIFEFLQLGSLDGIWYWDLETQNDEWMSPEFWKLLGFNPSEKKHLASEWQDLIFIEDLKEAIENFNKHCADPNHPYDQIVRYRHKDGSTVWVRCRGIAIRDETGKPIRMLGAHTDLTAFKRLEEELKMEQWRLQSIIESTDVGTWEWNLQTDEMHINERWAEITGYSLYELLPISIKTWEKIIHPEDHKYCVKQLDEHIKGKTEFYEVECRLKHKDGYWVWVLDKGKVCSWTTEGKPHMVFGTQQDITERKRAELELIESKERLHQLSKTDELTGLLNRRGWNECFTLEEKKFLRYGHQTCVAIIDLDGLKMVNDTQGHDAGDDLIRGAAHVIKEEVREIDNVARTGGDEFAILLTECNESAAHTILKRIENTLLTKDIKASWGVAISDPNSGLHEALAKADKLMYEMKIMRQTGEST